MSTEETPTAHTSHTPAEAQGPSQTSSPAQPPTTSQPPATPQPPAKLQPRSGPIVAGTLLLVVCAYVVVQSVSGPIDAKTWFIATILGLGVLLLLVGVAVLARGPRERR